MLDTGDVPVRRLSLEGGGHKAVCQQERWALKGVDWEVPHRLEKGTSDSENTGPRRGVDCEISHRLGRRPKHSLQGCGNLSLTDTF